MMKAKQFLSDLKTSKKVRNFGINSYCVEVDDEQIEVVRINDKEVNSFDDIMPVILEP